MLKLHRDWRGTLTIALLTLGLCGCEKAATPAPPPPAGPPTVQVALVSSHGSPQTIKVQGSLLGDEQAVVGVKVAGRVDKVEVDLGTRVKRGDRLAALDLIDFEVRVKQAEAEEASARAKLGLKAGQDAKKLDRTQTPTVLQEKALVDGARAAFDRATALSRNNAIPAEELQVAHTALKVAEARYNSALHMIAEQLAVLEMRTNTLVLAQHALADATITAPFDGIVASRHVAPGVYLQVGDPVVTLIRTDPLRFHAGVPEKNSLLVDVGQEVRIRIDGQDSPLVGKISRLSPVLNLSSRSLSMEVDVPNPELRLRAGLFAEAEIVVNPQALALVVPKSAVIEFAGVEKVYVVEDGKAVMRRVVTGRVVRDQIEVIEGLREREQVVIDGKAARPGPVVSLSPRVIPTKSPSASKEKRPSPPGS